MASSHGDGGEREIAADQSVDRPLDEPLAGTWEWDIASGRLTWSEGLQRLHGLAGDEFGGTFDDFVAGIAPKDRERVMQEITRSLEEGAQVFRVEYEGLLAGGYRLPYQAVGEIERDSDGSPLHMRGICWDASSVVERRWQRRALYAVSEALLAASDLDPGLHKLTATLGEHFSLLYVCFWALDPADGRLHLRSAWSAPGADPAFIETSARIALGPGEGLAGRSVQEQQAVWLEHLTSNEPFGGRAPAIEAGAVSAFSLPVRSPRRVLGAITCVSPHHITFDEDWANTLEAIAASVASFAERVIAHEEARSRAAQQAVVAQFGQFALHRSLAETLDECVRLCREALSADFTAALELLGGKRRLRVVAGAGWPEGVVGEALIDAGPDTQAGATLRNSGPLLVQELSSDRFLGSTVLHGLGVVSGISTIVGSEQDPWGVLAVHFTRPSDFNEDDGVFLAAMANVLAGAIERTQREASQAFLLRASELLFGSLDYQQTLSHLAQSVVDEGLAEWCTVQLVEADGALRTLELAHRDPQQLDALRRLRENSARMGRDGRVVGRVLRGKSVYGPEIADSDLLAAARSDEHLSALRELGLGALIAVPVSAQGRVLGALYAGTPEGGRRFTRADLATLEELGRRAGMAIEHAQLYGRMREALQVREDFVSIVSHELRTPLTTIVGSVGRMRRLADREGLPQPLAGIVDTLRAEAERMGRTLDLFLEMAGLESGHFEAMAEDVDIAALLRDEVRALPGSRQIEVRESYPPQPLTIRVDPVRVREVVGNLLSNAVKYGGSPPRIDVTLEEREASVVVRIRDNGAGISAEDREHIFERYFRASAARASGRGGLGLGLYISRQIAELLGGSLEFDSTPGEGSEFRLLLPR